MISGKKEELIMKNSKLFFSLCMVLVMLIFACSCHQQDDEMDKVIVDTTGETEESSLDSVFRGYLFYSVEDFHQAVLSAKPQFGKSDISTVEEYYVLTALPDFELGKFYVTSGMVQCLYFPKDVLASNKIEDIRYWEHGGYAITTYRGMKEKYDYTWEKERERLLSTPGRIWVEDKYVVDNYLDVCRLVFWDEEGMLIEMVLPRIDLTKVDIQEIIKLCAVEKIVISK